MGVLYSAPFFITNLSPAFLNNAGKNPLLAKSFSTKKS